MHHLSGQKTPAVHTVVMYATGSEVRLAGSNPGSATYWLCDSGQVTPPHLRFPVHNSAASLLFVHTSSSMNLLFLTPSRCLLHEAPSQHGCNLGVFFWDRRSL